MMKKIFCLFLVFSLLMSNFSYARIRDKYRPKEIEGNAEFVTNKEVEDYYEAMRKKLQDIDKSISSKIEQNEGARIKRERQFYENEKKDKGVTQ